jgi:alkylation response protein AidB-like acyl-CoA dehydrogenase
MDFALTSEQRSIQSQARHFAEQELVPLTSRQGQFPSHLIARMSELGFLAGPIDKRYGGADMDMLSYVLLCEELGRVNSLVRSLLTAHVSLVELSIQEWGSDEQKRAYLPKLTRGEWLGCYALNEPEAGSDAANLATIATQEDESYVLEGEKTWITNGLNARLAVIFASRDRAARQKGICAFLVETDTPGFRRRPMTDLPQNQSITGHAHITLTHCRVPASTLLGEPGAGFTIANSALDRGRLGEAAGAVGIGQACLEACITFVRHRRQFGQRLADFEMIQAALANMAADVEAARLLTYRAAWLTDRHEPATRAASTAKLFATEAATKAASESVLLHGNRGFPDQYPVERYYRDIKGLRIYEGNNHIQRVLIARDLIAYEEKPGRKRKS